jgi:hypothetical protein
MHPSGGSRGLPLFDLDFRGADHSECAKSPQHHVRSCIHLGEQLRGSDAACFSSVAYECTPEREVRRVRFTK